MTKRTTKFLFAIALLKSLTYSANFACGGLFLLNDYSRTLNNHKFYASAEYSRYHINYNDDWSKISVGSSNFFTGSLGYQSDYKYLTLGASIDSRPWITANMVLHAPDSSFYVSSELGRGLQNIAQVRWEYQKDMELIPDISADWDSHILSKKLSAGISLKNHRLDLAGLYLQSSLRNKETEYFIKDSLNIWNLNARYSYADNFSLGYRYLNANAVLYGIHSQEGDNKRFMYAPLSGIVHIGEFKINDILGSFIDLEALFMYVKGNLDNDGKRFHETLAPNRALRTSVLQALSFNFLQMNYRIKAEAKGTLGHAGLSYHRPFAHNFIEPKVAADFYVANATLNAEQTSETTKLISSTKKTENKSWDVESIGTILTIGFRLMHGPFHADINAHQLIPFTAKIDDHKELPEVPDTPVSPENSNKKKASYSLGNGLFCTLNIGFNF